MSDEYCVYCAQPIPPGAQTCPHCGKDQTPTTHGNFIRCSNGHVVSEGSEFCPWCGELVVKSANPSPQQSPSDIRETVRLSESTSKKTIIDRKGTKIAGSELPALTGFLVSYTMSTQGAFFPLREGRHTIGKGLNSTIRINDALLSDQHAVILYRNGKFTIGDSMSSNGSWVNGQEISDKVTLNHGDTLRLGSNAFVLVVVPKEDPLKNDPSHAS
ncbi:MAG: FHA domain-containing protein [Deltaproteobacteria bacterium]|nr:FHA domain-containing protein [Deltaproteobacteria bacterium]